jgi:hypothetical protein
MGYNEHVTLSAAQAINTSSQWIVFTGLSLKWESSITFIDKSSYFGNINTTGNNGNSILVDLGQCF